MNYSIEKFTYPVSSFFYGKYLNLPNGFKTPD